MGGGAPSGLRCPQTPRRRGGPCRVWGAWAGASFAAEGAPCIQHADRGGGGRAHRLLPARGLVVEPHCGLGMGGTSCAPGLAASGRTAKRKGPELSPGAGRVWPERVSVSCPAVGTPLPPASGRRPLPTGLPSWGFAECSQTPLLWSPEPLAAGEGRRRPWHSLRGAEGRAPGTGCGCGRTLGLPTMAPSPALQPRLPCPPVSAGRHPRPCVIGGPRPFAGQSPRASATCSEADLAAPPTGPPPPTVLSPLPPSHTEPGG